MSGMRELIAVRPRFGFDPCTIKRDALFFNRIAVPQDPNVFQEIKVRLAEMLGYGHSENRSGLLRIPDWLYEEEFLFEPRFSYRGELMGENAEYLEQFDASGDVKYRAEVELANDDDLNRNYQRIMNLPEDQQEAEIRDFFLDKETARLMPTINQIMEKLEVSSEHLARAMSIQLREQDELNALPVLNGKMTAPKRSSVAQEDVIQIVLDALPVPDDSVSWEELRDVRSDLDLQRHFLDLRRWMNGLSSGGYTVGEAKEELEYLLNEYQSYMNRRKIKSAIARMEVVLHAAAPLLKEKALIASGLALVLRGVSLFRGEVRGPGEEIAYIVKTRERLSRGSLN
jgi:hypothetical protein